MSDSDYTSAPNWSDEQWARVCKVVADEAQKARVAAEFLPLYGPVEPQVVAVPNFLLGVRPPSPAPFARAANRLDVDSTPDDFLTTISVQVPLPSYQVGDPELGAALVAFRRAAVTIAKIEDAIIFNGQFARSQPPPPTFPGGWLAGLPRVYSVSGGAAQPGLVPAGIVAAANRLAPAPRAANVFPRVPIRVTTPGVGAPQPQQGLYGRRLVRGVVRAITALEGNGQSGPFACFFSQHAYNAVHTPSPNLVLPRDRILPFLGGDYLRRTNTIPEGYGIIVALGGQPVEIVVARDISVRYQQQTGEPRFLFRVSEKIALRVKEWNAIAVLHPRRTRAGGGAPTSPTSPTRRRTRAGGGAPTSPTSPTRRRTRAGGGAPTSPTSPTRRRTRAGGGAPTSPTSPTRRRTRAGGGAPTSPTRRRTRAGGGAPTSPTRRRTRAGGGGSPESAETPEAGE